MWFYCLVSSLSTPQTLPLSSFSFTYGTRIMFLHKALRHSWRLLVCPCLSLPFSPNQMLCPHTLLALRCLFGGRAALVISFHRQPEKEVKAVSSCQPVCVQVCARPSSVCVRVCMSLHSCLKAEHMRKWNKIEFWGCQPAHFQQPVKI